MNVTGVPNLFDLTGRVAIVTGGGTGIGAASARLLAAHGADVVLASRTQGDLDRVAEEICTTSGVRALAVATDVRDEESTERLVDTTVTELGRVDILVNNAGGTRLEPLLTMPTRHWDNIVSVNLRGPFLLTRAAGRHMVEQGRGAIVNISSGAGVVGVKGGAHYSAAKAGLQMLTRVTAAELGARGVRANCIAVGLIGSDRAVRAWDNAGFDPRQLADRLPLGRVGEPRDIANAVLYLASDASSFVTGQTYGVDGGPIILD